MKRALAHACLGCGCTHELACPGGCSWALHTEQGSICSACVEITLKVLSAQFGFRIATEPPPKRKRKR